MLVRTTRDFTPAKFVLLVSAMVIALLITG